MTINVAVKCPAGLVLGADSLLSVVIAGQGPTAFMPYHCKLFQVGKLPVGVLFNGDSRVEAQTIEDLLAEFGDLERASDDFALAELIEELRDFVTGKISPQRAPDLQLIVAGFSQRPGSSRYGELFTLTWSAGRGTPPQGRIERLYQGDRGQQAFGPYFGGRPDPVYRFMAGFDRFTVLDLIGPRWDALYQQTRDYVFKQIEQAGGTVPDSVRDLPAPGYHDVPPWSLISEYDLNREPNAVIDPREFPTRVTELSWLRYAPDYSFFSLRLAVEFTWHMLLLPYAESSFMNRLPVVGSELQIATITRERGFKLVWRGLPGISQQT